MPGTKGSIKGLVAFGGAPGANATVTLSGPAAKEAKTGPDGQFVFKDLPPGDYKLEAKGVVKNSRRKGEAKATVPAPPPAKPIEVNVKLE